MFIGELGVATPFRKSEIRVDKMSSALGYLLKIIGLILCKRKGEKYEQYYYY